VAHAGAQVLVVSDQDGEAPLDSEVRWLSVPHRGRGQLRAPVGLERTLPGNDVLVLHSGWVYHNIVAARSAVQSGLPYILTPHGAYDPNVRRRRGSLKRLWWNALERRLVTRAVALHVFFEDQREHVRDLGYTGPVVVAPNGLTIPDFDAETVVPSDYLLWMGRFDLETKGVDLLLRALAALDPRERPQARLHGPDWRGGKQRAFELVRELGLEDSVVIGPALYGADKWRALRECRLFVFPSRWDAQGLIALEAAAVSAPLLVTNTTSLGRYLGANDAAVVVDATAESIAAGIIAAYSSQALNLGVRASQLVRERFSWPVVASSYATQIEALVEERFTATY